MWSKIKNFFIKVWGFLEKINWSLLIKDKINIFFFPFGILFVLLFLNPFNLLLWVCMVWWIFTIVKNLNDETLP